MGNSPLFGLFGESYFSGVQFQSINSSTMCDPQHPNIARQRRCHEMALDLLSRALSIDEDNPNVLDKEAAIKHYQKGIEQLEEGVNIELPNNSSNPSLVRAHKLKDKMRGNLVTAKERLNYLTTSLHLNTLSLNQGESRVPLSRQNTFTKDEIKAQSSSSSVPQSSKPRPARSRTADNPGTSKQSSIPSPVQSSSKPKINLNKAAELRLKTTGKVGPVTNKRTDSAGGKLNDKNGLKKACEVIKGCDSKLIELVLGEVVPKGATGVSFADISGQDKAKEALREMVIMPTLRPDLFTGLRTPARGLLLFGPPGNGKTLLARALAAEAGSNLINMSSSSLVSKWLGEGEKMIKTLFAVARHVQPVIIFIDEIDALLSERRSGEHEGVRRIKTEFLLQFEGMLTGVQERVVVVAATNRPQELDDAALRRFTKRIYVEMPDKDTRRSLLTSLLDKQGPPPPLSSRDIYKVVSLTQGYSCSDLTNLARDAALAPVREIPTSKLTTIKSQDMRLLNLQDFVKSSERVRKSLSADCLKSFEKWNEAFGDIS